LPTVENVAWRYRFGELIDAAQREPVSITRRGRTVVFVVSPAGLAELIDAKQGRAAAVAAYDADLSHVATRLGPEAAPLDDAKVAALVDEARAERLAPGQTA
jgi:hypothetical protein